jgi:hypothetical protein
MDGMMKDSKLSPAPPAPGGIDHYMARDAMHTIARAEEYKSDKALMKHVRALADQVHKAVGGDSMKMGAKKKPGTAAKNPSAGLTVGKGKAGMKAAMREQGKKASKLAPMGAAKKRER